MKALVLHPVEPTLASATRALGSGVRLAFSVGGESGELILQPCLASQSADAGLWLNTAVGTLWLSDAGAVLSLLSEQPVIADGPAQAWYWQFVSQQLSRPIARGLAPLEPLTADAPILDKPSMQQPMPPQKQMHCRLTVSLGTQHLYAYLSATPDTLLRWLQVPGWQHPPQPVAESLEIPFPLVLGRASLTARQLASLRPGDVLLPQQCLFDPGGSGYVDLVGRRWPAHTTYNEGRLFLTLSHEEYSEHEQP
ncbi:type III secretion system protein [Pseudomonas sp. GL-B-16]|uniref:type III secretion system protein n=1 Tax=Pseudomonas sp. GL-B-16 TaxID=2832373 RepID=UPI001CBBAC81|nr:type III secretion system protein [Pseudomonas sp. GL-B-16]